MSECKSIVDQMDNEIFSFTGDKPEEVNVELLHKESQENQRLNNGGGENNVLELKWLSSLKERQEENHKRKEQMIEEIEENQEINE